MQQGMPVVTPEWTWLRVVLYTLGSIVVVLRVRAMGSPAPPCPTCQTYDDAAPCTMNNSKIPRIIHQSYKTADLPERWKETPEMWRKMHPTWEYKFWSDHDNRELIRTKYPWFLETYDGYKYGISRADAARYFAIITYGGVYSDLDVQPLRDMTPLLCKKAPDGSPAGMIVTETPNMGVTNAFFAAEPNNKELIEWVAKLPNQTKFLDGMIPGLPWPSQHFEIMFSAGSSRYSLHMTHAEHAKDSTVARITKGEWGACSLCYSTCPAGKNSFFMHGVGNSWHGYDTMFLNFISCHPLFMFWTLLCLTLLAVQARSEFRAASASSDDQSFSNPPAFAERMQANFAQIWKVPSCYLWFPDVLAFLFVALLCGKPL